MILDHRDSTGKGPTCYIWAKAICPLQVHAFSIATHQNHNFSTLNYNIKFKLLKSVVVAITN